MTITYMDRHKGSGIQFFATREECIDIAITMRDSYHLYPVEIVKQGPTLECRPLDIELLPKSSFEVEFFARPVTSLNFSKYSAFFDANPARINLRYGGLQHGRIVESFLDTLTNEEALYKLAQRIFRGVKKNMKCGVYLQSVSGEEFFSKTYWYSEGIKKYILSGGKVTTINGFPLIFKVL